MDDTPMSMIDGINRALLGWLRRRQARFCVIGNVMMFGNQRFELADLARAVAYEADVYAGLVIALTLTFSGGGTITVSQQDDCWNDLWAALDRLEQTSVPSREWLVRLVAVDTRGQPIVLQRQHAIKA
jgi:hypothetical protein